MKFLAAILILASSAANAFVAKTYDAQVVRVLDGDTVVIAANYLPEPLKPELSVRIFGIDTPEKAPRAKCIAEAELGLAATAFTKQAVANAKTIQVSIMAWDKYGGRVLGDLLLNGNSLSKMLIDAGLARRYFGEKKESWCN